MAGKGDRHRKRSTNDLDKRDRQSAGEDSSLAKPCSDLASQIGQCGPGTLMVPTSVSELEAAAF